jgi:hypothetical protein
LLELGQSQQVKPYLVLLLHPNSDQFKDLYLLNWLIGFQKEELKEFQVVLIQEEEEEGQRELQKVEVVDEVLG